VGGNVNKRNKDLSGAVKQNLQKTKTRNKPKKGNIMNTATPFLLLALLSAGAAAADAPQQQVGDSPWGPKDEIGRLNLITPASRSAILSRVSGQKSYDLGVDFYIGMPSWQAAGDPPYQMWMTHTPHGNVVADSMKVGEKMNRHVSYTGSAVSMYAHMGTHIDALNHFGLNGKIWNGFSEAEHLGDRGWTVTGAEKLPPIIARGVLIDVATAKGVQKLPDNYRITRKDLRDALDLQGVKLEKGDVALIRTGRMRDYDNAQVFMANPPGLSLDGAKFLVEDGGAMVVGADNLSLEAFPSEVSDNYLPVHTYLLAQQGAPIIELVNLETLASDRVYQFAFIGASLKFRGGDAAPIRPIALPIQ
jgi:kynurenine formamidase